MPSLLITGGCGFIGSHIVEECIRRGYERIRILDNLSTGFQTNIKPFLSLPNVELMVGSIQHIDACREAVKGMTMICHQAALVSVPESLEKPSECHDINVTGFLNVLIAAKKEGIKRVVYATSSAVYGDDTRSSKQEDSLGKALSPYAVTKRMNELHADMVTSSYGMEVIGLRYFNVYGPRQNPKGPYAAVISKFTELLRNEQPVTIFGDGSFSRDFVFVRDIVQANLLALETTNPHCFGSIYNIGTGQSCTILELYTRLQQILKQTPISPIIQPNRPGDIAHSRADIQKACQELCYQPKYDLQTGLSEFIESL